MKSDNSQNSKIAETFLNNINHEIRTPVQSIMGFSELLKQGDIDKKEPFLDSIIKNSRKLVGFIDNLIYLAQLQHGTIQPEKKNVDIKEVLHSIFNTIEEKHSKIREGTVQLVMKEPGDSNDLIVETDETMITSMFYQLLDNAIKFTPKGSIEFGYVRKTDNYITFFVKDTGIGISDEHKDNIFNGFFNGNLPQANNSACGMGLSICKYLADYLEGDITFETEYGKGTTFYFTIPYKPVKPNDGAEITDSNTACLSYTTALVVDDDEASLVYVKEVLENAGLIVYTAKTGNTGIECVKNHNNIDVVIMDIQLPDMNGYTATEKIKSIYNDVTVIVVTGYSFNPETQNHKNHVWDDWMVKPVLQNALLAKLAINRKKEAKEL